MMYGINRAYDREGVDCMPQNSAKKRSVDGSQEDLCYIVQPRKKLSRKSFSAYIRLEYTDKEIKEELAILDIA